MEQLMNLAGTYLNGMHMPAIRWTDIVEIACGDDHTLGLKADGTLVAAGSNGKGQCDVTGWTNIRVGGEAEAAAQTQPTEAPTEPAAEPETVHALIRRDVPTESVLVEPSALESRTAQPDASDVERPLAAVTSVVAVPPVAVKHGKAAS